MLRDYKAKIIGSFAIFIVGIAYFIYLKTSAPMPLPLDIPIESAAKHPADTLHQVHIAGEVQFPGVYEVPVGTRVYDALRYAGGPTPMANLDTAHLAKETTDGMRILVKRSKVPHSSPNHPTISINFATKSRLESVPGLGPKLAQRIVTHRDNFGRFHSLEDLTEVTGIGSRRLRQIRPYLSL